MDHSSLGIRKPAELLRQGKVKDMLGAEIREELGKRGAPIIGKRWELEARLEKLLARDGLRPTTASTEEPADRGEQPRPSAAEAQAQRVDAEAGFAKEKATGIRAKYAAALEAKKKGMVQTKDAAPALTSSAWALQPGVKELLQYLDMRGMARALLPRCDLPRSPRDLHGMSQVASRRFFRLPSDDHAEPSDGEAGALARQLQVPAFAHVLLHEGGAAAGVRASDPACVLEACDALGLHGWLTRRPPALLTTAPHRPFSRVGAPQK